LRCWLEIKAEHIGFDLELAMAWDL
jgi:hypothetical protein